MPPSFPSNPSPEEGKVVRLFLRTPLLPQIGHRDGAGAPGAPLVQQDDPKEAHGALEPGGRVKRTGGGEARAA